MAALRSARNDAGMTLVEVLVGITVSSLVMMMIGAIYLAVLNMDRRGRDLRDLGDVSIAIESLANELRQASRQPEGVVIWARETDGIRHDTVGVLSTRLQIDGRESTEDVPSSTPRWTGWIYFVHDLSRGELWRIEQAGDNSAAPPSTNGGRILARHVRSFGVTREANLLEVEIVAVKRGQTVRLRTAIWPRNE